MVALIHEHPAYKIVFIIYLDTSNGKFKQFFLFIISLCLKWVFSLNM